jgi:hypothetical protein
MLIPLLKTAGRTNCLKRGTGKIPYFRKSIEKGKRTEPDPYFIIDPEKQIG